MTRKDKIDFQRRFFARAGENLLAVKKMMDTLPNVGFYVKDAEGRLVALNKRNCEICNFRDEFAAVGRRSDELFADGRGATYLSEDRKVRSSERMINIRHQQTADGSMRLAHKTIAPVRDRRGAVIGTMAVYRYETEPLSSLDWHKRIKAITAHINGHPTGDLSLSALAELGDTTPSKLVRAFQKILHLTPTAYVMRMRVVRARRLLESTDWSQSKIARDCGFYDLSHFFHAFRRDRGLTPSAYRAQHGAI